MNREQYASVASAHKTIYSESDVKKIVLSGITMACLLTYQDNTEEI
jgi:hypothetical protein